MAFMINTKPQTDAHGTEWFTFKVVGESEPVEFELLIKSSLSQDFIAAEGYCRRSQRDADQNASVGSKDFEVSPEAIKASLKANKQFTQAIASFLVKDWRGVVDHNGNPVEYDSNEGREGIMTILENFPTVRGEVIDHATEIAFRIKRQEDETVGKQ